jgi:MSHA biogenesis protein MshP
MKQLRYANGFALMAAMFIIVTLGAIGVYLLTISTGQLAAGAQDEQAARAYQAARAGIDWAAYQVLRNSGGAFATTTCTTAPTPPGSQTLNTLGTLGSPGGTTFQATITCARTPDAEGGTSIQVYVVTSTGCNRASCPVTVPDATYATYVERQLRLVVAN